MLILLKLQLQAKLMILNKTFNSGTRRKEGGAGTIIVTITLPPPENHTCTKFRASSLASPTKKVAEVSPW